MAFSLMTSGSLLLSVLAISQQAIHLSIEEAYALARKNYPDIKQKDLVTKTKEYTISNASKGYLPAFNINGQATYQSDVTNFPLKLPGYSFPSFSKDQYKIYGEVDQVIYDGGAIRNQKQTAQVNEQVQQQNLEVELYALYDRVDQLYFGALLEDEQIKQNDLLKKDIQNGIEKVQAQIDNGTAYKSSADELQAQLLQTEQSRVELLSLRKAYLDMLALFVNEPLDENTLLEKPADMNSLQDQINRPELLMYDFQKRSYDLQDELLNVQLRPHFSFFLQGGYARPGLNLLSNDFEWYYIGGVRLSWNLGGLYMLKNSRKVLDLDRQTLDIEKETFVFNTRMTQKQQGQDIAKFQKLIDKDGDIIALRESVKNAAQAQLENGVLSAHDYITEVDAEDQARQNRILHQVQLLQSQYSYQNTVGINISK
jgi:outer membrane protein TolC